MHVLHAPCGVMCVCVVCCVCYSVLTLCGVMCAEAGDNLGVSLLPEELTDSTAAPWTEELYQFQLEYQKEEAKASAKLCNIGAHARFINARCMLTSHTAPYDVLDAVYDSSYAQFPSNHGFWMDLLRDCSCVNGHGDIRKWHFRTTSKSASFVD